MRILIWGLATLVIATVWGEGYITTVQLPSGETKKIRDEETASEIFTVADNATNYVDIATNALEISLTSTIATSIADANTSYRQFTSITNVNQSVQYITSVSGGIIDIQVPANESGIKDWIVYLKLPQSANLRLPNATWWMADPQYTNSIPANVPTSLYFSEISDGIYTIGRQEMVAIPIGQ